MVTNAPLYLAYTENEGLSARFMALSGREEYDHLRQGCKEVDRFVTDLHAHVDLPGKPQLEIVCLTSRRLSAPAARSIGEKAVDYLFNAGLLGALGTGIARH